MLAFTVLGITVSSTMIALAFILAVATLVMIAGALRIIASDPKGLNIQKLKSILHLGRRVLTFTVFFSIIVSLLTFGVHLYTAATEVIPTAWEGVGGLLGPQATVVGASLGMTVAIITVILNHRLAKRRAREEWQRQSVFDLLDSTHDILLDYQRQFTHTCRQMSLLAVSEPGSSKAALENAKDSYVDLQHIQNRFQSNIRRVSMLYPKSIYFRGSTMAGFDKILRRITRNFETALGMELTSSSSTAPTLAKFDQDATTRLLFKLTEAFDVIAYSTKELITSDAVGSLAYKIMGLMVMLGFGHRPEEDAHHHAEGHKDLALILADTTPIAIQDVRRMERV